MPDQVELSIIKAERLNKLKERVKNECLRRKYPYGRFTVGVNDKGKPVDQYGEDSWDFNPAPSNGLDILTETYENISIPIRKINHKGSQYNISSDTKIPNGPFNRVVTDEDLTLFEVKLTALESRAIDDKTSTDCSVSCTGTCTTTCTGTCSGSATGGDVCTSCASNCSGICGNNCSNNCSAFCGDAGCSGYCGYGCVGNCVISCFSAASKSSLKQAASKYGVTISPTTCGDACVGNCAKDCGQDCGPSCGVSCATYSIILVCNDHEGDPPRTFENLSTTKRKVSVPPRPDSVNYSIKTKRYWTLVVTKPGTDTPLNASYEPEKFYKGIYLPGDGDRCYFEGTIGPYPGDTNVSVGTAMGEGYNYRFEIHSTPISPILQKKVYHYTEIKGNVAVTEEIYAVNLLAENYGNIYD